MIDIKRAVSNNRTVTFTSYRNESLWYQTEFGEIFPVLISDIGSAAFGATEKAILLMRYMRKWNDIEKSEVDKLADRLYDDADGRTTLNFGFTNGPDWDDPETIVASINTALDQVESMRIWD